MLLDSVKLIKMNTVGDVELYYILLPFNVLSLAGSLFVILLYSFAKPLRIYAFKLVLWISVTDFIRAFVLLMPTVYFERLSGKCDVLAAFYVFAFTKGHLWSLCISVSMFQCLFFKDLDIEKYYKFWVVGITGFSAASSIGIAFYGGYQFQGTFCDVDYKNGDIIFYIFLLLGPAWVSVVAITIIYASIIYKIITKMIAYNNEIVYRFAAYPVVLMACMLPSSLMWAYEEKRSKFNVLETAFLSLFCVHGFFNCLAYAVTEPVISYFKGVKRSYLNNSLLSFQKV